MKITDSCLQTQGSALMYRRERREESLRIEIMAPRREAPDTVRASISDAAREAASAETHACGSNETDKDELDPRLQVLIRVIEALTGRKVVFYRGPDSAPEAAPPQIERPEASPPPARPPEPEWSIRYERHHLREEAEIASFSASGEVSTADGRRIRFDLDLHMARYEREASSEIIEASNRPKKDPLVLNLQGGAVSLEAARFEFDLDADGKQESLARLGSGSVFLAFDRNGNGSIDNGQELFGPASNEGFSELAVLDDDGNGWIDEGDAAWQRLRTWRPGEALHTLAEAGVGAIALEHRATPYTLKDETGKTAGAIRDSGVFLFESGSAGSVQQIDLVV